MEKQLALAEAQLLGFFHAQKGHSLKDLVQGMGLTRSEWDRLKEDGYADHLSDQDKLDIDDCIKN